MTILKKASTSFIQDGTNMHSALSFHRRKYMRYLGCVRDWQRAYWQQINSRKTHRLRWGRGKKKPFSMVMEIALENAARALSWSTIKTALIHNRKIMGENGTNYCPLVSNSLLNPVPHPRYSYLLSSWPIWFATNGINDWSLVLIELLAWLPRQIKGVQNCIACCFSWTCWNITARKT